MAELLIISETGMFHSACRCTWGTKVQWFGFKPIEHRRPAGKGFVDTSDRTSQINHQISFTVNDTALLLAVDTVSKQYDGAEYILGVRDCVSFSADLAWNAGLTVAHVNMTPYGFILYLAARNEYLQRS
jgi:hypothetical protein